MATERTKTGGTQGGKHAAQSATKPGDINLEALFQDLEGRAREFLGSAEKWVGQGDELLGKAKTWIEEHPVALAIATKYGRKVSFVPRSKEELRAVAGSARTRVTGGASRAYQVARENPMELAVVGLAIGTIAWAAIRATRPAV